MHKRLLEESAPSALHSQIQLLQEHLQHLLVEVINSLQQLKVGELRQARKAKHQCICKPCNYTV